MKAYKQSPQTNNKPWHMAADPPAPNTDRLITINMLTFLK